MAGQINNLELCYEHINNAQHSICKSMAEVLIFNCKISLSLKANVKQTEFQFHAFANALTLAAINCTMFKKLFSSKAEPGLVEPVFPTENYSIFKLTVDNGLAFATMNTGYNNYPNKSNFPWCAQILLSIQDKNDNGHPIDEEAVVLNDIEVRITEFLKRTQVVHPIGRVTRNGERDIIYYIDKPKFNQKETKEFFDEINAIRNLNFTLEEDAKWKLVGAFIK
jgi:hypothetical protein